MVTSFAVKPRPSIDFWSSNGVLQTDDPQNRTILSSTATNRGLIRVEEFHFGQCEIPDLMFKQHVFAMNVGDSLSCEYKDGARFRQRVHATGPFASFQAIGLFASACCWRKPRWVITFM